MCQKHGRKALVSLSLNPVKKTIMKLSLTGITSFQLKWLERLLLYHFNDDSNLQARLFAFLHGFRAGVSTETVLHEFVRHI